MCELASCEDDDCHARKLAVRKRAMRVTLLEGLPYALGVASRNCIGPAGTAVVDISSGLYGAHTRGHKEATSPKTSKTSAKLTC